MILLWFLMESLDEQVEELRSQCSQDLIVIEVNPHLLILACILIGNNYHMCHGIVLCVRNKMGWTRETLDIIPY